MTGAFLSCGDTIVAMAVRSTEPGVLAAFRALLGLRLVAQGLTNAEIAARLHLSEGTIRNYVSSLMSKLEVADRTQAAVLALRHGLSDL